MTKLQWDLTGERRFEVGIDHGVLYLIDGGGNYADAHAWNGLTAVTETPSGADANPLYADNIKYLNLIATEQFAADVEAYTYPDAWGQCDGTWSPEPGVDVHQQAHSMFGLSYRTRVGNDVEGEEFGYKLHMVYGATAAPSQKAYTTINDKPAAITFKWTVSTVPVPVTGGRPTSLLTIDSTQVDATALAALEAALYGTSGSDARLPMPDEVLAFFSGTITTVVPTVPTYDSGTHTITIPTVTGVKYQIDGKTVTGTVVLTSGQQKVVNAVPLAGYKFADETDSDWQFTY